MAESTAADASTSRTEAAHIARNIKGYFEARCSAVDKLITERAAGIGSQLDFPVSIASVGGYGRRELFPHSDIDLLILVENEAEVAAIKDAVADFTRDIWDAGGKLSQSVRTVAECCRLNEQNVELHISLLDLRFITGGREPFENLERRLPEFYQQIGLKIIRVISEMARQRHAKFQDTVYHLEPNVKEGPGGLRDIHLLNWLAQLAPEKDVLRDAVEEVRPARDFLAGVRAFLHVATGRDSNLLSFELQDEIAATLSEESTRPEDWMRVYYRQARSVFQNARRAIEFTGPSSSLFKQFRGWRERLSTAEFTVSHEQIYLRNAAISLASAESVMSLFSFVARHGLTLSWDTQRKARARLPELRQVYESKPAPFHFWRELLSQPHASLALHQMEETGLLAVALPDWRAVESLVVRDFYHRYTVDEHSLIAIQAIDGLYAINSDSPQRYRELAREYDSPAAIKMALLLHDIGKGTTPGDHVKGSLEVADQFLSLLGTPSDEAGLIRFLIEHHLDLSSVMNGRDLNDPATARYVAARAGTQENLRALVLFTYADISAVNPSAFTPWRAEQLWRVYTIGEERLTRELSSDRIHEGSHNIARLIGSPDADRFLEGFPTRYALVHSGEQIRHHMELDKKRKREGVAVEITREPGAYRLTLVAGDEPGLFAAVCGTLASYGMDILKAEAASNASGCILDEFRFADPMRTLELNPDEIGRLEWTIACVVKGAIQVPDLLKRRRPAPRSKALPKTPARVVFDNNASDSSTLIEFVGDDRPGLLYDLASTLSGSKCNIELVLIDTEAHRAIDVFYVTEAGAKLRERTHKDLEQKLLRAAVGPA